MAVLDMLQITFGYNAEHQLNVVNIRGFNTSYDPTRCAVLLIRIEYVSYIKLCGSIDDEL